MIILQISTIEVIGIGLGGGAFGVIAVAIIQWIRFRNKDVHESEKVEAETEKIKMEAYQIKAAADVAISEAALKLVQRITEECNEIRKNVDKLEAELVLLNAELRAERDKNKKLIAEIEMLKKSK